MSGIGGGLCRELRYAMVGGVHEIYNPNLLKGYKFCVDEIHQGRALRLRNGVSMRQLWWLEKIQKVCRGEGCNTMISYC